MKLKKRLFRVYNEARRRLGFDSIPKKRLDKQLKNIEEEVRLEEDN